ncbi:uncharacterized protein KIAA1614 homolog [Trichosurus vulpecula]|uniref:uncharacterized protein KIAA1614 homolog n=1 Tax=Trichosurus vulpecula TaxID=9337 RepID=UPI00186AFA63|nr:uncharacterized protein KIAA1614 homolog [Trichosurus vulpecula]XP_036612267.1 uncharacterized protein KIAA1614 homolog [Trichosurus vulpecula]
MEAASPVERRRSGKGMKEQGGRKPHRSPLQPQEARGPGAMASEPVSVWAGQPQGPSVLECKVRALKEKRMLSGKQAGSASTVSQERPSLKKAKSRRAKPGAATPVAEGASSQDSVVAPQAPMRTYLTDRLLDSGDDLEQGTVHTLPASHNSTQSPNQLSLGEESQRLPEGVWRPPDLSLLQEANYFQEGPIQTFSQNRPEIPGPCRDLAQMLSLENGKSEALAKHHIQVGDLDEAPLALQQKDPVCETTLQGQLWRAGSWDGLRSGNHSLSLADRVERNRLLLQERRSLSEHSCSQLHQVGHPARAHDGPTPELSGGDLDWDSGVSLQDSDGCRAFVPSQELLLSPRHEQAKQLLQQARMKARTSPLRANHDIIPAVVPRLPGRDANSGTGQNPRVTLASRDGDAPYGGSLSDSSSGESSCGQRRKRGPSPSRVRFEDESAQDAEVRYRERLQQPQKRALDSVLRSLGQGPLVSKPDLSNYINGDFHARETQGVEACWGPPNKGSTGGLGRRSLPGKVPELNAEGTCHTCGSYIQGVPRDLDLCPMERKMPPGRSHSQEGEDAWTVKECQGIPYAESSASRGLASPIWILPSRQRLHTEHIRETYIGEVTFPDEVDSALDSTDTSDSCRTDSEEAGTPHRRNRGRARGSGHPAHPRGRRAGGTQKRGREPEMEKVEGTQAWDNQVEVGGRFEEARSAPEGSSLPKEDHGPKLSVPEAEGISTEDQSTVVPPPLAIARQNYKWTHTEDTQAPCGALNTMASSQPLALSVPGVEAQISGSQELLKSAAASHPQPPNHVSPARRSSHGSPQQAKKPAQPFTLGTWVPTPPTVKRAPSPVPYRKAVLARTIGPDNQRDPTDAHQLSLTENDSGLGGVTLVENQLSPPRIKHHLLVPSTSDFNSIGPREQLNIQRRGVRESQREKGPASREPESSAGKSRDGGFLGLPESTVTSSLSSTGITVSVATEQPQSSMEMENKLQRVKPSSEKNVSKRASPGAPSGPSTPLAIPASGSKKGNSISSALGLKKFFSILGQTTRQKLGKFRCYSMEQIPPPPLDQAQQSEIHHAHSSKMKKTPSLQSLQLVSPSHQHRKAGSVQNLHSLLGKVDRSSRYLVGDGGEPRASGRQPGITPRRSLSVDDIGVPNLVRTVGRIVEVFPDGTSQLELQRPPNGTFGFCVSSGNGRPDSGFYVQEIADANTAKLYSGLLGVGDEILEVNGAKVTGLGLALVNELLSQSESLSIRVLKQRGPRR